MLPIGNKFWNLRTPFYVAFGLVDLGTHMSFIELTNGKFLLLDTVKLDSDTKAAIDKLTNNGELIDSVVATHAFHTIYFEDFYKNYPNAKYYGTARHLSIIPSVKWTGDICADNNFKLWESEGVEFRVTDGCDLLDETHFSGLFVYHKPSKTVHNDDTIVYFNEMGWILSLVGRPKRFNLHPKAKQALTTPEAPLQFKRWLEKLLDDWDFENIVVAHHGHVIGGAKEGIRNMIQAKTPFLEALAKENAENGK